ncbi:hypothetical protein [Streptomyces sp. NPDC007929]
MGRDALADRFPRTVGVSFVATHRQVSGGEVLRQVPMTASRQ